MHKSVNIAQNINIIKDKNYMIISIDVEKIFSKVQHLFMIRKKLKKFSIEKSYLNIINPSFNISVANIMLSGENLKAFPLNQE
jgi:hypothetical protein